MKTYIGVFDNGQEYAIEVDDKRSAKNAFFIRQICDKIIRLSGIKTNRKKPENISFNLFSLCIENGKLKRIELGKQNCIPPLEFMTEEEYLEEVELILQETPKEFHGFIKKYAWEIGHNAGFEEIIMIAAQMSESLKQSIQQYVEKI